MRVSSSSTTLAWAAGSGSPARPKSFATDCRLLATNGNQAGIVILEVVIPIRHAQAILVDTRSHARVVADIRTYAKTVGRGNPIRFR